MYWIPWCFVQLWSARVLAEQQRGEWHGTSHETTGQGTGRNPRSHCHRIQTCEYRLHCNKKTMPTWHLFINAQSTKSDCVRTAELQLSPPPKKTCENMLCEESEAFLWVIERYKGVNYIKTTFQILDLGQGDNRIPISCCMKPVWLNVGPYQLDDSYFFIQNGWHLLHKRRLHI